MNEHGGSGQDWESDRWDARQFGRQFAVNFGLIAIAGTGGALYYGFEWGYWLGMIVASAFIAALLAGAAHLGYWLRSRIDSDQ